MVIFIIVFIIIFVVRQLPRTVDIFLFLVISVLFVFKFPVRPCIDSKKIKNGKWINKNTSYQCMTVKLTVPGIQVGNNVHIFHNDSRIFFSLALCVIVE